MKKIWLFTWVLIAITEMLSFSSYGDVIIFFNGDTRYGKIIEDVSVSCTIDINGVTETFSKKCVEKIIAGINQPASGEIASSTDGKFVHKPSGNIYDITGDIAIRKKMTNTDGRDFKMDVETTFDIPTCRFFPANYSFYNRRGTYLIGSVTNKADQIWQGIEFRVTLFNKQDKLIGSKDFYVFRLPKAGRRSFELALPDIPYDMIDRIRIVRKF